VIHESAHQIFLLAEAPRTRRTWNRTFGWLVAAPFGVHYGRQWERGHLQHHLDPIVPGDPQAGNRLTGRPLLIVVLGQLLVPGFVLVHRFVVRATTGLKAPGNGPVMLVMLAFWGGIFAWSWTAIGWAVPPALMLGLQLTAALNEIKGGLEHGGEIAFDPDPLLRSRTSLFPLRHVFLPFNISLHFEHHLSSSVPWYRLPAYQAALRGVVPAALHPDIFNRDLLAQLSGRKGRIPQAG
jgi:fatty acid desaturase